MDRLFIENLRLDCRIGVTDEERRRPQGLLLDVSYYLDLGRAGRSGRVRETLDYREARQKVSDYVSSGEFVLLESLAEGLASLALLDGRVRRVVVKARKAKYSVEPSIGVEIERRREE